jgi:hypothetical protein
MKQTYVTLLFLTVGFGIFYWLDYGSVNGTIWLIGGAILLTFLGIRSILEKMRIERNMDKELTPKRLKEILTNIYKGGADDLPPTEKTKAKLWLDEMIVKIDLKEIKTLRDCLKYVQAQDAKISMFEFEKGIKNKENLATKKSVNRE